MAEQGTMLHAKQEIPTVLVDSVSKRNNEARIKQDELELEELRKQARAARGEVDEPQEETTEAEPSSEEPKAEPVQAESDTKQEEKPEAKAQEEDDLSPEEKNFKKRYGDLRRHSQKKKKSLMLR